MPEVLRKNDTVRKEEDVEQKPESREDNKMMISEGVNMKTEGKRAIRVA